MPTYEYRCRDCGHELEVVQAFSDDPLTQCPACEGSLRKVFGNVGISFKGSGFYKTDSRSSNGTSSSSSSESSSSESSSSGSESSASGSSSSSEKASTPAAASA
ncbi:FmdB family zinc ribbon protein [Rhabdothermincola sediminis]|uniref:FmdB family zinc ribbon protein n=1 Tax=Rhabdothermincola sediminis TaxID=2751370 RepID=UPI001AA03DF5|nr:FmdB family zinc ribbon protein [Rhabdothermincola sediminis]